MFKEWKVIEKLYSEGLSLMPIYDKTTIVNGVEKYAKQPCMRWGFYTKQRMPIGELYSNMEKYDTTAIGIICGAVSGGLEILDLDVKNWLGIDAKLFADIQLLYPKLFDKLRIHKTPSGGYHILYRVPDHEPEGNRKLCWKEGQKEAAIETRSSGGYCAAPPSLNYEIFKENKIPVITWADRCALIALCESYNEKVKIVEYKETSKRVNDYYDENPFDHFNGSADGETVLSQHGWNKLNENNRFIWFTRPDKDKGVSASFNKDKRIYFVFTSSTSFEPQKGYKPSTALAILQFNNDRKETYKYLISKGFGKINKNKELSAAKKLAKTGASDVPKNFSEEAKAIFEKEVDINNEKYPHGIFWDWNNDSSKYDISREALYRVCDGLGLRNYRGEVIIINGYKFKYLDTRQFQDTLKSYIKEEDPKEYEDICNAYEDFLQKKGDFTMSRLAILEESEILKDSRDICYKFFLNGCVMVTPGKIGFFSYEDMNGKLIHEKKIQDREYYYFKGGRYVDFLDKAINLNSNQEYYNKIIGYLSHEYRDALSGYIIVLTEMCPDPMDGGGTGKNVFCSLLTLTTTVCEKDGSQTKYDEKFFQSWNYERIMVISDVRKDFNFGFLKNASTGKFTLKKLFKDEINIPVEDGPKFIIPTNFSFDVTDGGLRRRIIPIEFTDFFTKTKGIDIHYGVHFPDQWDKEDLNGFDTFIMESIAVWLASNRKIDPLALSGTGIEKQMETIHGVSTMQFIRDNIDNLCNLGKIESKDFGKMRNSYFVENSIKFPPSAIRLNRALTEYCKHNGIDLEINKEGTDLLGTSCRYYIFKRDA